MGTLDLYEKDFFAWTQQQKDILKKKEFDKLDIAHLQEELHSMGATEKRELSHRLEILLMHLLKWKYQPERKCKSWERTIKAQRIDLIRHLKNNPSLNARFNEYIVDSYEKAIIYAADETNLDESMFPDKCEWSIDQIIDNQFLP